MDERAQPSAQPQPQEIPLALNSTASMELELPVDDIDKTDSPFHSAAVGNGDPLMPADDNRLFPSPMERSHSLRLGCISRSGIDVLVWGRGDCGQLGDGAVVDSSQPHRLESLLGKDIVNVSAGPFHTAVVTADGEVYVWGDNSEGQLGVRTADLVGASEASGTSLPLRVEALENFAIRSVSCGTGHTLAVADDGKVLAFGLAEHGQIGVGPVDATRIDRPKLVKTLSEHSSQRHIIHVAAGGKHSVFLDAHSVIDTCGDGTFGALGLGGTKNFDVPRSLLSLWPVGVSQIAAGESHSAALTFDGTLFTWGRGRSGQLGLGDFQNASRPTLVKRLSGGCLTQVSCGGDHTIVVTATGEVYSWGQGTWGATGLSHVDNVCTPQRVESMAGQRVVAASAGGRHTLLLTASNQIWGMGCNENGQLGVDNGGSSGNGGIVLAPKRVLGLPENREVLFVEAGGDHSLAVMAAVARPPPGPPDGTGITRGITQQFSRLLPPPQLKELIDRASMPGGDLNNDPSAVQALVDAIEQVFACPAWLLHSLPGAQRIKGSPPIESMNIGGTDSSMIFSSSQEDIAAIVNGVGEVYQNMLQIYDQDIVTALGASSVRLLNMIEKFLQQQQQSEATVHGAAPSPGSAKPRSVYNNTCILAGDLLPELSWLPAVVALLWQNPLASDPTSYGSHIIHRLGKIIASTLPATQRIPVRRAVQALLRNLPDDVFAARCVRPVQRYISHVVKAHPGGTARLQLMMAGVLLDVLLQADNDAGGKIPYHEFYNKELSASLDLHAEYLAWVRHRESSPFALVSFCQMPYLLDPEAKSRILHGEAMIQKEQHMGAAAMQAFFQGQNPSEAGFLKIAVRRTHVVEDALNALVIHGGDDLKKPLRVTFVSGGVSEPAQDEGGVRKEFFQLLSRDLFRPEFGMFLYDEATRQYWFNPASFEAAEEYALVGALVGLAIYNAVLLDIHFPLVLYKKLLGVVPPNFADLKAAFPELGRGLQALLDYEPADDVQSVFCRSFEVEYEFYGEKKIQELKPGGSALPVTGASRQEYVELYTRWVLQDSVDAQFNAFKHAFLRVCGGPSLTMFTPAELELLACGLPHLDFEGLRRAATYEGGYTPECPAIQWFWEIVGGMTLEQKRQFLSFTTGSDRAPVGGLSHLSLRVQRSGPDTDRLPTSHTCFNTLLLPEYATINKMKERLLTAITNATGFGLQ